MASVFRYERCDSIEIGAGIMQEKCHVCAIVRELIDQGHVKPGSPPFIVLGKALFTVSFSHLHYNIM